MEGRVILDRQSGGAVWTVPAATADARMIVGPRQFVGVAERKGGVRIIAEYTVPEEELAKVTDLIRSGAQPSDIGLPDLTRVTLKGTDGAELPASITWAYQPDPATFQRKPLPQPPKIESADSRPTQVMCARNANQVVIGLNHHRYVDRKQQAVTTFCMFDTESLRQNTFEMTGFYRVSAVSPQGKYLLLGNRRGR